jgi:hypothetical protein
VPELPVKEIRPAELHLPEIKREQIVRALSEIHLPTIEIPDGLSKIDWRAIDPSSIDVGKAVAGVVAATRLGKPMIRTSRLTIAIGTLVVIGLAAAALLSTPAVRERAGRTVRGVRARVGARAGASDMLEIDDDVLVETASDAVTSIESGLGDLVPVMDVGTSEAADTPDREESTSPV